MFTSTKSLKCSADFILNVVTSKQWDLFLITHFLVLASEEHQSSLSVPELFSAKPSFDETLKVFGTICTDV